MCEKFSCFFFFNFRDRNGRFLFDILTAKGVISQHRNPNKLEVISKTKAPSPHCTFVAVAHGIRSVSVLLAITGPTSWTQAHSSLHLLRCYGLCMWPLVSLFRAEWHQCERQAL